MLSSKDASIGTKDLHLCSVYYSMKIRDNTEKHRNPQGSAFQGQVVRNFRGIHIWIAVARY